MRDGVIYPLDQISGESEDKASSPASESQAWEHQALEIVISLSTPLQARSKRDCLSYDIRTHFITTSMVQNWESREVSGGR